MTAIMNVPGDFTLFLIGEFENGVPTVEEMFGGNPKKKKKKKKKEKTFEEEVAKLPQ